MALNYSLDLTIDEESLRFLRTSQLRITLAKPVGGDSPNVTWIVFDPFGANKVEWTEEFGLYASPTQLIQNGATITRISDKFPISDASYYSFDNSATFNGPNTGTEAPNRGSFKVYNDMPSSQYPVLTFGLEQKAVVNGGEIQPSFLNAAIVPSQLNATFTPITTVYVWVQAFFTSGTVITEINGTAAVVKYFGETFHQSLVWNPESGHFIPANENGETLTFEESPNVSLYQRPGVYSPPSLQPASVY